MRWLVKAAVQGTLSQLPRSAQLNLFVKHRLGIAPDFQRVLRQKCDQVSNHIEYFQSCDARDLSDVVVGEIGTGTYPIMPVLLWLVGINRVVSVDIVRIANERTIRDISVLITNPDYSGVLRNLGVSKERLAELRDRIAHASTRFDSELLAELGIEFVIADLSRDANCLDGCDLIISNNVFEHIRPDDLQSIIENTVGVNNQLRLASHVIDLSDHYSHFDSKIGSQNFLKYSKRMWALFNNKLAYQNRLRASDYRKLFDSSGWTIEAEAVKLPAGFTGIQNRVHPDFEGYEESDLAAVEMWIGARS